MRTHTVISVFAGLAIACSAPARAGFTGLSVEPFVGEGWLEHGYGEAGLVTYRLYADFDGGSDDGVAGVFGITDSPMHLGSTDGTFHNDPVIGRDTAPFDLRDAGIWSNQWDTYVTINATDANGDETVLLGDEFEGLAESWTTESGIWFVPPDSAQAGTRDGRVLLGQFSLRQGEGVFGEVTLLLRDRSAVRHSFAFPSCPADFDKSGAVGFADLLRLLRAWGVCDDCPEDLDGNGVVDFADLLALLGAWGPCHLEPTPVTIDCACCKGSCPGDIDGDGRVGFNDLLILLGQFGQCEGGCRGDIDCSGVVDVRDLLFIIIGWGPCPSS